MCRKDFAPSEIAALGLKLETYFKPKAKASHRTKSAIGGKTKGEWLLIIIQYGYLIMARSPERLAPHQQQVGEALGVSGPTYQRI